MAVLMRDLRYGLRTLLKTPAFTAVAVLTLALGIGANAIIFSFVDSIWLRPMAVPRAAEVVRVYTSDPGGEGARGYSSYPDYLDIRAQSKTLSGLAAQEDRGGYFDNGVESKLVTAAVVSENFFSVLGVKPVSGRLFTEAELGDPKALDVMVSNAFWHREFNASPKLAGSTIVIDNQQVHVAGVLPADFRGSEPMAVRDIWIPMATWDRLVPDSQRLTRRGRRTFELFGRVDPRYRVGAANAELATIAARLAQQYPVSNAGRTVTALPLAQTTGEVAARIGPMLLAVAAFVLLIACANLASLLLARSEHRRKEIATRLALGATRARIVRQLLTENALLAVLASAVGLLLAAALSDVIPALLPQAGIPLTLDTHVDMRVALFAVACGLVCVAVFGIVPAVQASDVSLVRALNRQVATEGGARAPVRSVLVVAQVALSLVMVVAAGLLVRSVYRAYASDPGFNAHQEMLIADVSPGFALRNDAGSAAYVREARARIEHLPGVLSTTASYRVPFGWSYGGATRKVFLPGAAAGTAAQLGTTVHYTAVADRYFETLGTALLRGRAIDLHDYETQAHVAVINQQMANAFWPGKEAVGQHFSLNAEWSNDNKPSGAEWEVVGVAADGKYNDLNESPMPYLFLPLPPGEQGEVVIAIKTSVAAGSLAGPVRAALRAVNPAVPTIEFATLHAHFSDAIFDQRLTARLVGALGALGLVLAAVGLYGLMAFMVGNRTQEIGIRMALGAVPEQIFRLMIGRALWLTGIGVIVGCVGAVAATRALRTLLYGVTPTDTASFAIAVVILLAVALGAALIPALRATRLDPMQALRNE